MLSAIIGILFLFADQLIKFWTVSHIELNTGIRELFPGILHMTYIKNYGAAFGVFSNAPWLRWVLLGLLVCFTLFILLGVRRGGYLRTGFARFTGMMLLAGLLGNGIDRAIYGYVVDMFELEFINFAIFNLADVLVVFFGILFCIALIAGGIGRADNYEDDEDDYEYARRRSSREEPQRAHRSSASGQQTRRGSGSGQTRRPSSSGSGQAARRTSSSGTSQAAKRPAGGSQTARRPVENSQPARRPRPAESGMSVRPLVPPQAAAPEAETKTPAPETPAEVKPAAPAEAKPVAPAETKPVAPAAPAEAKPVAPAAPVETKPAADATRTFQPVSAPAQPKADPDATRTFTPVNIPAQPKADPDATRTFAPVSAPAQPKAPAAPAAQPAAKPAAKASDDFDLDSILAEFK